MEPMHDVTYDQKQIKNSNRKTSNKKRLAASNRVLEREVEELQASTRDFLESELAQARDSLEETLNNVAAL
eukprot:791566-Amphidinium_carterae.1